MPKSTRETNEVPIAPPGAHGRLSDTDQAAPMPRNFGSDNNIPHPELIRNVDSRHLWDRNIATPFGDNPDDPGSFDDPVYESDY